jgi:hypothetical protein
MNPSLLVKFFLTRGGSMASPSLVHHIGLLDTAPERTGGRTVPVVATIRFLTISGRTRSNREIGNLRLFGTVGITVRSCPTDAR